jgi:hypothetical protein
VRIREGVEVDQGLEGEGYGLISRPGGRVGLKANRGALPRATCQLDKNVCTLAYPGQMRESRE